MPRKLQLLWQRWVNTNYEYFTCSNWVACSKASSIINPNFIHFIRRIYVQSLQNRFKQFGNKDFNVIIYRQVFRNRNHKIAKLLRNLSWRILGHNLLLASFAKLQLIRHHEPRNIAWPESDGEVWRSRDCRKYEKFYWQGKIQI